MTKLAVVAGAGGFIGGHLVHRLLREGYAVRAVDIKHHTQWWQDHAEHPGTLYHWQLDLRSAENCEAACEGAHVVFNLGADMGGIGYITSHKLDCMLSVLINTHLLLACDKLKVPRYFYAGSACAYPTPRQQAVDLPPLRESDAYPAYPEDGYGWEKLFSERMCWHFAQERQLDVRVARFHTTYGPHGSWNDGREKAPLAICRKIAEAVRDGRHELSIWGDGLQTRSFTWIGDNIDGILRILREPVHETVTLGSAEVVTINQLVDLVEEIAGVRCLTRQYNLAAPQGVRGRGSDNTLIRKYLGWEPQTSLREGLTQTYAWVKQQVDQTGGSGHAESIAASGAGAVQGSTLAGGASASAGGPAGQPE